MEKHARMLKLAKEWKATGISMSQYAQQRGIDYKSFVYWCNKLKTEENLPDHKPENNQSHVNPSFIEVLDNTASSSVNSRPAQIELELANGLRIKIY